MFNIIKTQLFADSQSNAGMSMSVISTLMFVLKIEELYMQFITANISF